MSSRWQQSETRLIQRTIYETQKPPGHRIVFSQFDDGSGELLGLNERGEVLFGGSGELPPEIEPFRDLQTFLTTIGQHMFYDEEPKPICIETGEEVDRIPDLVQEAEKFVRKTFDSQKDPGIRAVAICKVGTKYSWILIAQNEIAAAAHLIGEVFKPDEMVVFSEVYMGGLKASENLDDFPNRIRDWPEERRHEGIYFVFGSNELPLDRQFIIPLEEDRSLGNFINLSHHVAEGRLTRAIEGVRDPADIKALLDEMGEKGLLILEEVFRSGDAPSSQWEEPID